MTVVLLVLTHLLALSGGWAVGILMGASERVVVDEDDEG